MCGHNFTTDFDELTIMKLKYFDRDRREYEVENKINDYDKSLLLLRFCEFIWVRWEFHIWK